MCPSAVIGATDTRRSSLLEKACKIRQADCIASWVLTDQPRDEHDTAVQGGAVADHRDDVAAKLVHKDLTVAHDGKRAVQFVELSLDARDAVCAVCERLVLHIPLQCMYRASINMLRWYRASEYIW